jgi:hypothetical protein
MADNKFEILFYFRKAGIGALSYTPIESFGITIEYNRQTTLEASWNDVFATFQEIEKQGSQQMKILKSIYGMKMKPIDEKLPKKFFGMAWYPSSRHAKSFDELQKLQGKKFPGDDGKMTVRVVSGHEKEFTLSSMMVLGVRKDPRQGNQMVQFEFEKMEPGRR